MEEIRVVGLDYHSKESRYKNNKKYRDEAQRFFLEPPIPVEIEVSEGDAYFEVTVETENRLDLVASKTYNNSKLWWVIAEANEIEDPLEVPVGKVLVVPSISSIFGEGGIV